MKKGFASMAIVYSFLLVFLLTLSSLLAVYSSKLIFIDSVVSEGKEQIEGYSYFRPKMQVVAGNTTAFMLDKDGILWAAGSNANGMLGYGNAITSTLYGYVRIKNSDNTKFAIISSRYDHSLAIDENGTTWGWGYNTSYQVGNGVTTTAYTPVKVTNTDGTKFVYVTAGKQYSMAIDENGTTWGWGNAGYGRLGNGTTSSSSNKSKITNTAGTKFVKIMAGDDHTMAIDEQGSLWTWGNNTYGQLGNNTTTQSLIPIRIKYGTKFIDISPGANHSAAIDENGGLWTWGYNGQGCLGNNSTTQSNIPINIKTGTKFTSVKSGAYHTMAIDENGNLWTWGYNNNGQLGNNSTTLSLIPIMITNIDNSTFTSISTSSYAVMAIDNTKKIWLWGQNTSGQLGNGGVTNVLKPGNLIMAKATKLALAAHTTYNIDANNKLWAWGYGGQGNLGNNGTTNTSLPIRVTNSGGTDFVSVAAGYYHVTAIDASGGLWAWGYNSNGQLGNNSTTQSTIPIKIKDGTSFIYVSNGQAYSTAIDAAGGLWAWGINSNGQLGNGGATQSNVPIKIKDGTSFSMVSAANTHTLAIDVNGGLWSWGLNTYGQLGNNSVIQSLVPINITHPEGKKFVFVSAGTDHSTAIDEAGAMWTWGQNTSYQLGTGNTTVYKIPTKISNTDGTKFVYVSAGDTCTLATDENGTLWVWGSGGYGRLGYGSTSTYTTKTKVTNVEGTKTLIVVSRYWHSGAIDTNGSLWQWGYNGYGGLGNNTTTDSYIPIRTFNNYLR